MWIKWRTFVIIAALINMLTSYELRAPAEHTALCGDLVVWYDIPRPPDASSTTAPPSENSTATTNDDEEREGSAETEEDDEPDDVEATVALLYGEGGDLVASRRVRGPGNGTLVFQCELVSHGGRYRFRMVHEGRTVAESEYLDVRWPEVTVNVTEFLETYHGPIHARIEFGKTACYPVALPFHLWAELVYCGRNLSDCGHGSPRPRLLYSHEIVKFYKFGSVDMKLDCSLFGQAGAYQLHLVSNLSDARVVASSRPIRVEWSNKFVFNVLSEGSIFPCDTHISVLFQYPTCILERDKIRVYGKKRADVTSVYPPTQTVYVAQKTVIKGKHRLFFDCELFSEKYIEYCFVYVSTASTGAVNDVRQDCVPTLPVSEAGNWGPWSPWTTCTTSCGGGKRNRYRSCDAPPPSYGAKFCNGSSLESEDCAPEPCPGSGTTIFPANRPDIRSEMGPYCSCGCVIHLEAFKAVRPLATTTQDCRGRALWLIQAEKKQVINFTVEHFLLPCDSQWLKVRDGDSLSSTLVADLTGNHVSSAPVTSSGPNMLVEFFSEPELNKSCFGGFLAYIQQKDPRWNDSVAWEMASASGSAYLHAVHVAVILFVCVVLVVTVVLALQYFLRYRKYERAAIETSSVLSSPTSDCPDTYSLIQVMTSTTTLSEVISLTKFGRRVRARLAGNDDSDSDTACIQSATSPEEALRDSQKLLATSAPAALSLPASPYSKRRIPKPSPTSIRRSLTFSPRSESRAAIYRRRKKFHKELVSPVDEEDPSAIMSPEDARISSNDPGAGKAKDDEAAKRLSSSTGSEEAVTKKDKRKSREFKEDAKPRQNGEKSQKSGKRKLDAKQRYGKKDGKSPEKVKDVKSNANAENASRSKMKDAIKESKEKQNRERLKSVKDLPRAGAILKQYSSVSEFSIPGTDLDLEFDYYDYNVQNACAAPGSYLGMDPAYLIWIPPFAPFPDQDFPTAAEQVDLVEFPAARGEHQAEVEKETRVEKSPTLQNDDDIRFADEDDESEPEVLKKNCSDVTNNSMNAIEV